MSFSCDIVLTYYCSLICAKLFTDAVEMMEILCNDFPTEKDLMDSVDSIYRIQVVYDLQPKDLANGLLNGVQYK